MADFTPNYNLKKPLRTEYYNVADANGNSDIVDGQLKAVNDRVGVVEGDVVALELGKVDKVAGKQLSDENYTLIEKNKVANLPADTNAQLAETEQRIDGIVTTPVPTGTVIAEEIIDARDGALSLGAKIRNLVSQVTGFAVQVATKRAHINTVAGDSVIPFEIHNQAGQAGADVSSEVTHHYTDATAKVIDNVGAGTILMLSNSQNPIMRPDLASDYVGTGNMLKYRKFNNATQVYDDVLVIDNKGNIERKSVEEALNVIVRKTNNGYPALNIDSPTRQDLFINLRNGGGFLSLFDEIAGTKAAIVSHASKTTGLELRAEAGSLYLQAPNGTVQIRFNGQLYQGQLCMSMTTANRPATNLTKGRSMFDETLGKPIWWNGTAWVDAMGTVV